MKHLVEMAGGNELVAIAGMDEEAAGHSAMRRALEGHNVGAETETNTGRGPGENGGVAEEPAVV